MRGSKLTFGDSGPDFDFSSVQKDFDCTVQNMLVNIGTQLGSDPNFKDRGTTLAIDAAQGRMVNGVLSKQAANFAALHTTAFLNKTEMQGNKHRLQSVRLQVDRLKEQRLDLLAFAVSTTGESRGTLNTL